MVFKVQKVGGDERNRTADPLLARQVLSQLSYAPTFLLLSAKTCLVGLSGLEPLTSRLSGVRSNRLSYKPRLILQKLSCHIITLLYMFSVTANLRFTVKLLIKSGSHLLSHAVSSIVPSAA